MNFNITCKELSEQLNLKVQGNTSLIIKNVNRIAFAKANELTFLSSEEFLQYLDKLQDCAIITYPQLQSKAHPSCCFIPSDNPYDTFIEILRAFDKKNKKIKNGIHPKAIVSENAIINDTAFIGAGAVIGNNCKIGDSVVIKANCVINDNVEIGDKTIINSNVSIYDDCKIGENCIIHSGAVIGADGFGFEEDKNTGAFYKIPQLGNVIIEDNVEIGANSTIDCAIAGSTIIKNGVKIDNLVHIAHNCIIGEYTAIAGQTGISGSSIIGARNRFGGQVGFAGHTETVDDVIIIAQSGVSKSITQKGIYMGSPAKDKRRSFLIEASLRNLPELTHEIKDIKKEIESLKRKIEE